MKTTKKQEYDEAEVELVMEAYGVGRTRAIGILRSKFPRKKKSQGDDGGVKASVGHGKNDPDDLMDAEEFFGI